MAGGDGLGSLIAAEGEEFGEVVPVEEGGRAGGGAVIAEDYRGFFGVTSLEVLAEEVGGVEGLVGEEDQDGFESRIYK